MPGQDGEIYGPILSAADRAEEEARIQRSKDAEWLFKYVMMAQVTIVPRIIS